MMDDKTSQQRTSLLRKNIVLSGVFKGWSALVLLLIVPVTLNCLGEYSNGVWLTISSILVWIDLMDIGLGNGLRNKLAIHLAHHEIPQARSLISSAFAMLFCIMVPTTIILLFIISVFDTYGFLNVDSEQINNLDEILMVTIIFVCTTFIFKLIGNVYMGMQQPAVNNLLVASGQTLALIFTYILFFCGSHSILMIAIVNTISPLIVYMIAYVFTFYYKYPHLRPTRRMVSLSKAKEVMSMGVQFFVLQISGIILFMSTNILISRLFSPAMVTPYQITYRYFSLLTAIFSVVCVPFWNATTDAYERNDTEWIKKADKKLNLLIVFTFFIAIVMVVASPYVYAIWIGNDINIDIEISIAMACYIFIIIYSMRYSFLINGIGKLRLQLIFTVIAAVVFIPLSYAVVLWKNDILWFIIIMCAIHIPGLIVNRIQFHKLISGKAKGIWIK